MEGTWKLPQGELTLKQNFPDDFRHAQVRQDATPITNGRLNGDQISFTAGGAQYTGRVNGNAIEGTVKSGGSNSKWSATRAGKPAAGRSGSSSAPFRLRSHRAPVGANVGQRAGVLPLRPAGGST